MNKLYFGRVAPIEAQKEQVEGDGWAWRFKVRIFDKHPADKNILPDEDLPWAQVLLPVTAGSGAANYAVTPNINQGDTVSIAYYDEDEQQPVITGILPRTKSVPQGPANPTNGYVPTTGFTEGKRPNSLTPQDESNEQTGEGSQPTTRSDRLSGVFGDTAVMADACDPNAYKTNSMTMELNNLFNQINQFSNDIGYVESLIAGTTDRIHSITNEIVGDMINNLFEALLPVLNAGLKALYQAVYAAVLAATSGNTLAARLAAEAALIALQPAVMALQEAISIIAAQVVSEMFPDVNAIIVDAVKNKTFGQCSAEQFVSAIMNDIIDKLDAGILPLILVLAQILSGGFSPGGTLRSSADLARSFVGGAFSPNQGGNKCKGLLKEYAYGLGPKEDLGDILDDVLSAANLGKSIVESYNGSKDRFLQTFGDFPFMSSDTGGLSDLDNCTSRPPDKCFGPTVKIFGGRGEGAKAKAYVGRYVKTKDERTVGEVQGGIVSIEVTDGGEGYVYPPFVTIQDNCGLGIGGVARAIIRGGKVKRIIVVQPGEGYPSDGTETFVVDDVEIIDGGDNYVPGVIEDGFGNIYEVITGNPLDGTIRKPINIEQFRPEETVLTKDEFEEIITRFPDIPPDTINELINTLPEETIIVDLIDIIDNEPGIPPKDKEEIITIIITKPITPPGTLPTGPIVEIKPIGPVIPVPFPPVITVPSIDPPIPPGGTLDPDTGIVFDVDKRPVAPRNGVPGDRAVIGRGLKARSTVVPLPSLEDIQNGNVPLNLRERFAQTDLVQIIDCVES